LAQLKAELQTKFSNYVGAVQYKSNIDDWKPAIIAAIGGLLPRRGAGR